MDQAIIGIEKMVGIIILNYNNVQLTIGCVESIIKYNSYPAQIVVVDNASSDNSVEILNDYLRLHEGVFRLLVSPENGGYARGNNIGLEYFDTIQDVTEIMVLNNDVIFTNDIIPEMVSFLSIHHEAGLVSPMLRQRDGVSIDNSCARKDCEFAEIIWSFFLYFTDFLGIISKYRKRSRIPINVDMEAITIELPSGSCMMIRKELFRSLGYFDPHTFLYFEENILYRKILAKGLVNYVLPGISCIHLGGETTNKVAHPAEYMKKSKSSAYYYAKNYRENSWFQRLILEVSYRFFIISVSIVKSIKGE